jgi:hypothetical protein
MGKNAGDGPADFPLAVTVQAAVQMDRGFGG